MPTSLAERIAALAGQHAPPAAVAWLNTQLAVGRGAARAQNDFAIAFSGAGRRFGTAPLPDGAESAIDDPTAALVIARRGLDEIARVALLISELAPDAPRAGDALAVVNDLFYRGDMREKQAVLRALSLLPEPARFLDIPTEACRSSVQDIFDAVACENPYPADHFPDTTFNHMVLKALFVQTPVARIHGLDRRVTDELVRMCEYYGSERRAAGRTVPEDIQYIAALPRRS